MNKEIGTLEQPYFFGLKATFTDFDRVRWLCAADVDGYIYHADKSDTPRAVIRNLFRKIEEGEQARLDQRRKGRWFRRLMRDEKRERQEAEGKLDYFMFRGPYPKGAR